MSASKKRDKKALNTFLSIIIPVYNRQQGLSNLLQNLALGNSSRLGQIEIIVVDDGSAKSLRLPDLDLPVVLYRLENNLGAPKARQYGFNKSNGNFIHFHDSDDNFGENWLSKLFDELEAFPETDILLTARYDISDTDSRFRYQKFFHRNICHVKRIQKRLIYRNCMGPLGGVTFSRKVLMPISFKNFASCQDWQMYLEAIKYAKYLRSYTHITYHFNVVGSDRISHNPGKKILGHLQLSRSTRRHSIFRSNIRFFYLVTCKVHILKKKGRVLAFYKTNQGKMWFYYVLVSIYWRLS